MDLPHNRKMRITDTIDNVLMELMSRPLGEFHDRLSPFQALILQRILDTTEPNAAALERLSKHDLVFNTIAVFVTVAFIIQDRLDQDLFSKTGLDDVF